MMIAICANQQQSFEWDELTKADASGTMVAATMTVTATAGVNKLAASVPLSVRVCGLGPTLAGNGDGHAETNDKRSMMRVDETMTADRDAAAAARLRAQRRAEQSKSSHRARAVGKTATWIAIEHMLTHEIFTWFAML